MLGKEYIDIILKDAEEIPLKASEFKDYPDEVFNYKTSGWSAAECFEHLLKMNQSYIPIFDDILKLYTDSAGKEFKNSFVGKYLIKSIHPDASLKVKTFAGFMPGRADLSKSIIDDYLRQHFVIKGYIEKFRNFDIRNIKIKSPMSSFVKYNLGDACRIIIFHDLRHLKQADRAVKKFERKTV
jgi:hypothetical protein